MGLYSRLLSHPKIKRLQIWFDDKLKIDFVDFDDYNHDDNLADKSSAKVKILFKILALAIMVFGLFVYLNSRIDTDFGWHIASGFEYLESGVPKTDLYSYTSPDYQWVNHAWLQDVGIALVYELAGFSAVALAYALVWVLGLLAAFRRLHWLMVPALLATMPVVAIRPVAFSFLFLGLLFIIIEKRIYFALVPLFLLWSNLHAGFIAGLIVLAYQILRTKDRMLVALSLPILIVTLINPYGFGLYVEIIETFRPGVDLMSVVEWRPLLLVVSWTLLVYSALAIAGWLLVVKNKFSSLFSVTVIFLMMSLASARHLPLLIAASAYPVSVYWDAILRQVGNYRDWSSKKVIVLIGLFLIGLQIFFFYGYFETRQREDGYPVKAVAILRQKPCTGNIFNSYNYGGFLIWRYPDAKYFIDGRMPHWRDSSDQPILNVYLKVLKDPRYRLQVFDRYDVGCVLMSNADLSAEQDESDLNLYDSLTKQEGFSEDYAGEYYKLLRKNSNNY